MYLLPLKWHVGVTDNSFIKHLLCGEILLIAWPDDVIEATCFTTFFCNLSSVPDIW